MRSTFYLTNADHYEVHFLLDMLEYLFSCAMVDTVVEVDDLLKTGLSCLVFTLHPVGALVQPLLVLCAVGLRALLLYHRCGVHQVLLLLLLQTSLASPVPASPASGPCAGLYDCTSTENSLLTHFARLPDISACRARCREDVRCQHFTFNYKLESLYPGACFLLTSCSLRRPGASQWVSEARDCAVLPAPPTLPRHYRDLVVLVRTQ